MIPAVSQSHQTKAPQFSGLETAFVTQLPALQRALAQGASWMEGRETFAYTKFAQDTLSVWVPRVSTSRSWAEAAEVTFYEFAQSFVVWFSIHMMAKGLLKPLARRAGIDPALMTKNLKNLSDLTPALRNKAILAKAAMIIAPLGIAMSAGEYANSFWKNLLTVTAFKKKKFSDVVNLSDGKATQDESKALIRKALTRIAICYGIAGTLLGGSLLLAKSAQNVKKVPAFMEKFVNFLDFGFKNGRINMTGNQLWTYIAVFFVGYMDSIRDRLERMEVLTRLAIVLPNLAVGDKLIRRFLMNRFAKPGVLAKNFKGVDNNNDGLLDNNVLFKNAREEAEKAFKNVAHVTEEQIDKKAAEIVKPLIKNKNFLFYMPLLINVSVIGFGTALLNRMWTKIRFNRAQKKQAQQAKLQALIAQGAINQFSRAQGFTGYVNGVAQQRVSRFGTSVTITHQQQIRA